MAKCPRCDGKGECLGRGYCYRCPQCIGKGTVINAKRRARARQSHGAKLRKALRSGKDIG